MKKAVFLLLLASAMFGAALSRASADDEDEGFCGITDRGRYYCCNSTSTICD